MESNGKLSDIVDFILKHIEKLPKPLREPLKKELLIMKEMLIDSRPPKLIFIGRRGSGKSSLINAIFGEHVADIGSVESKTAIGKWYAYRSKNNKNSEIEVLDTRGLGDNTIPDGANFSNTLDSIKYEIDRKCPDIIIFLCRAKDVDSYISEDANNILEIQKYIDTKYKYKCPLISLATQVDELDPASIIEPPFANEKKQQNIRKAIEVLEKALFDKNIQTIKTFPVCAYLEFDNDNISISYDRRWNIDLLNEYLLEALPESAQLELARISKIKSVQNKLADKVIGVTVSFCSIIGVTPIPFSDLPIITAAQISMIIAIGYIGGRDLDKKGAREFLAAIGVNVGAAFAIREGARALIKVVFPGSGDVIAGAIAGAATLALGNAAKAYFIEGKSIEKLDIPKDDSKIKTHKLANFIKKLISIHVN